MPILNIKTQSIGEIGTIPSIAYLNTNDTEAQVTAVGYLNSAQQNGAGFTPNMIILVATETSVGAAPQTGWYSIVHDATLNNWSLTGVTEPGSVTLPTIASHLAVFTDVNGTLGEDVATAIQGGNIQAGLSGTAGYFRSFPSVAAKGSLELVAVANTGDTLTIISNAAMGQASTISITDPGASTANFILSANATGQTITTGNLALTLGALTLGSSGHASSLTIFPTTAANGTLILSAVNAGGAFNTTISSGIIGQSTVYTLPDSGTATAKIAVAAAATVSGNLVKASGVAGQLADAGFAVLAKTTSSYAGGGTSNAFTATGLATTSIVTASILTSTNSVSITKVVPTANTLTITFSADPGAATTVSYIAISPAV